MQIQFYKYQGTGNDFVILDNRGKKYSGLTTEQVRCMCNRRFGIGADGLMNRHQDLQQDEHTTDQCQRRDQALALLHSADQRTHRDGKQRRQHTAQNEHDPPDDRQQPVGARQHRKELPLVAFSKAHGCDSGR